MSADREVSRGIPTRNGIRVDPVKDLAWRQRSKPLQRRKPLEAKANADRNRARLTTNIGKTKPPKPKRDADELPNDWTDEVRAVCFARAGGRCELHGCPNPAQHLHHRKLRRHGDHRVVNGLYICLDHHDRIHRMGLRAYVRGLLVKAHRDPAVVPLRLVDDDDREVFLTPDGQYQEAA